MKIQVRREIFSDKSTIGRLFVDGVFECYTLEDVVRSGPKIPAQTAIPFGTYDLTVDHSNHFQRDLPLLLNVPEFDGVRIHPGNTAADTEGCILVAKCAGTDSISNSRDAFNQLFAKINRCIADGGHVNIEVVDCRPAAPIQV